MLIESIIGRIEDYGAEQFERDYLILDHYAMEKPHQRATTEHGRQLSISLPHGEKLFCGAVLYREDDVLVVVDLISEEALEIRPRDNLEWGKAAFNIGNMHLPAYLHQDCIIIPYDFAMERILSAMGIPLKKCMRKINGQRANYTQHEHAHGHECEHVHHHKHDQGSECEHHHDDMKTHG